MNERIRELTEQAFFETEYDDVQNLPETMERFAELIVRECALTAGLMEHQGRKNIGAQILDNFGIKENE